VTDGEPARVDAGPFLADIGRFAVAVLLRQRLPAREDLIDAGPESQAAALDEVDAKSGRAARKWLGLGEPAAPGPAGEHRAAGTAWGDKPALVRHIRDEALSTIRSARPGGQHDALLEQSYRLACVCKADGLQWSDARDALMGAGREMVPDSAQEPWTERELAQIVDSAWDKAVAADPPEDSATWRERHGRPAAASPSSGSADCEFSRRQDSPAPTDDPDNFEFVGACEPPAGATDPPAAGPSSDEEGDPGPQPRVGGADPKGGAPSDLGEWDAGEDTAPIPPRAWLLGTQFCRGFLSALIAAGAAGKTSLRIVQLLSLAVGRTLLPGQYVFQRCRVLLISLEDGKDELRRRVTAAMMHHKVDRADVRGWLFLSTPKGLKLAEMRDGSPRAAALLDFVRQTVIRRRIDVVSLDPFIKSHGVPENDNNAIDFVTTLLTTLATELDIAVDATRHTRKGTPASGDPDSGRGAGAFKDAGRLVYSLVPMTPEEANEFGVGARERPSLVRLDNAKVNLAPAAEAQWFRLVGVTLGNASVTYPKGDEVQTVETWIPPDPWASVSPAIANRILDRIDAGLADGRRYSSAKQASNGDRAAWRVVQAELPDLSEKECKRIVAAWLENGVMAMKPYQDPVRRKKSTGLTVDPTRRPTGHQSAPPIGDDP
jgi:hypothetical protein